MIACGLAAHLFMSFLLQLLRWEPSVELVTMIIGKVDSSVPLASLHHGQSISTLTFHGRD